MLKHLLKQSVFYYVLKVKLLLDFNVCTAVKYVENVKNIIKMNIHDKNKYWKKWLSGDNIK